MKSFLSNITFLIAIVVGMTSMSEAAEHPAEPIWISLDNIAEAQKAIKEEILDDKNKPISLNFVGCDFAYFIPSDKNALNKNEREKLKNLFKRVTEIHILYLNNKGIYWNKVQEGASEFFNLLAQSKKEPGAYQLTSLRVENSNSSAPPIFGNPNNYSTASIAQEKIIDVISEKLGSFTNLTTLILTARVNIYRLQSFKTLFDNLQKLNKLENLDISGLLGIQPPEYSQLASVLPCLCDLKTFTAAHWGNIHLGYLSQQSLTLKSAERKKAMEVLILGALTLPHLGTINLGQFHDNDWQDILHGPKLGWLRDKKQGLLSFLNQWGLKEETTKSYDSAITVKLVKEKKGWWRFW